MSTDKDIVVTVCECCNGLPITPYVKRPAIRIQLNGPGGVWESQTLDVNDTLEIAFRKNGGTWVKLPRDYEIKNGPKPNHQLIGYVVFKLEDTPMPSGG
jgi:hypothetical protein